MAIKGKTAEAVFTDEFEVRDEPCPPRPKPDYHDFEARRDLPLQDPALVSE